MVFRLDFDLVKVGLDLARGIEVVTDECAGWVDFAGEDNHLVCVALQGHGPQGVHRTHTLVD